MEAIGHAGAAIGILGTNGVVRTHTRTAIIFPRNQWGANPLTTPPI